MFGPFVVVVVAVVVLAAVVVVVAYRVMKNTAPRGAGWGPP